MSSVLAKRKLQPHPDYPAPPIKIGSKVTLVGSDLLKFEYAAIGEVSRLCLPQRALSERTDGLWKHSCFEAFIGRSDATSYIEFNFSPSTLWASYRFASYRDGMQQALDLPAPDICTETDNEGRFSLTAWLDLAKMDDLWPMSLGLSAVLEDRDGGLSYWALAHPSGKPDFHHRDCFALTLPAPRAA